MQSKSRSSGTETQPSFLSGSYYDAKPTFIDSDSPYDVKDKSLNNMFDFERAKQKFDNISRSAAPGGAGGNSKRSSSQGQNGSKQQSSSQSSSVSGIPKRQSSGATASGSNTNNSGSGLTGSSYYDCNNFSDNRCDDSIPLLSSGAGINDTIQFFDTDMPQSQKGVGGGGGVGSKLNITKMNNINLDALKVSEDDTVSWVVC